MSAVEGLTPTRTRASHKPRVGDEDVPFFQCAASPWVLMGLTDGTSATFADAESRRSPVAQLPYRTLGTPKNDEDVRLLQAAVPPEELGLTYQFIGGFNNNAMEVRWRTGADIPEVQFVALKTFTGMQVKYHLPKKPPRILFAFADEDAYCYCDLDPCEECVFRCKHGFALYAYGREMGLVHVPCDRMDDAWVGRARSK